MAIQALVIVTLLLGALVTAQTPPALTAIGGTGTFKDWYLNGAKNQYLVQNSNNKWAITLVSGNLYTITNGGWYLSALVGGNGYNTDGADKNYNQFTFSQQGDGTWIIFNPYLQAYNGYGYLCVYSTPYGPYSPYFSRSAYNFALPASTPPTPAPTLAPTPAPTPAPTLPPTPAPTPAPTAPPGPGPAGVKALKDARSNWYINNNNNPYLSSTPIQFTIEAVPNSNLFTIRYGNSYVSAKVGGSGYSTEGPSLAYNQFQFQLQSDGRYIIYSPFLFAYNGYGWLTSTSTPYGAYLWYLNSASGNYWTLV